MGKTSFLHRLEQRLEKAGRQAIFVDASSVDDLAGLLLLIRTRVERELPRSDPPSLDWVRRTLIGAADVLDMLRDLDRSDLMKPPVLLVDEISSAEIAHTLFGRLRDEVWSLPYIWVVAGDAAQRPVYLRPPADAFFGTILTLEPFDPRDAIEFLKRRFPEMAAAKRRVLAAVGGGNPRRLVDLARQVLVDGKSVEELADIEERQARVVDDLGPSARLLLDGVRARGSVSASDQDLLQQLGWTRNRATQVLNELERAGLLTAAPEKGGRKKIYTVA